MAASLTNQDDETGPAAESAVAGKPSLIYGLQFRFSHGPWHFFLPLIEMLYQSKIILESNHPSDESAGSNTHLFCEGVC